MAGEGRRSRGSPRGLATDVAGDGGVCWKVGCRAIYIDSESVTRPPGAERGCRRCKLLSTMSVVFKQGGEISTCLEHSRSEDEDVLPRRLDDCINGG
jgi:hypothetical protein